MLETMQLITKPLDKLSGAKCELTIYGQVVTSTQVRLLFSKEII